MAVFQRPWNTVLAAVTILIGSVFALKILLFQGDALVVALVLMGMLLFLALLSNTFFVLLTCFAIASVNVNLVGIDPGDILIPFLFGMGLLAGHLEIRSLRLPLVLVFLFSIFVLSYGLSLTINEFDSSFVAHLVSNVAFLGFLKAYVVSERRMRQVLVSLLVGACVTSSLAIAAIINIWLPGDMFFDPVNTPRYVALISDPNILAVLAVPLALWLMDELLSPKLLAVPKWVLCTILILAIAEIALTQSRSGWLNLGVGFCAYMAWDILRGGRERVVLGLAVIITLFVASTGILLIFGLEDTLSKRFTSIIVQDSPEEEERFNLEYTKNAIGVALRHPLGVGPGRAGESIGQMSIHGTYLGAHNSFVQVLLENGWVAFVAFVSMVSIIGLSLLRKLIGEQSAFGLSYQFLTSALLGLVASGMFQDLIEWQVAWLLPALAVTALWPTGGLAGMAKVVDFGPPSPENPKPRLA
jgi:hypothetical protein